jgi:hypothetical protein
MTQEPCCEALNFFLEVTVRVGLICQPCKTIPPAQEVKYCGFLYNTVGVPYLGVPDSKVDRSLATIAYLRTALQPIDCLVSPWRWLLGSSNLWWTPHPTT